MFIIIKSWVVAYTGVTGRGCERVGMISMYWIVGCARMMSMGL
ncbi:hypothetical protein [Aquimarina longa]|nr:hypothetical protein [Aquimarina longa]